MKKKHAECRGSVNGFRVSLSVDSIFFSRPKIPLS